MTAPLQVGSLVATWVEDGLQYEPEGIVTMIDENGAIYVKWFDFPEYSMFDEPWKHSRGQLVVVET